MQSLCGQSPTLDLQNLSAPSNALTIFFDPSTQTPPPVVDQHDNTGNGTINGSNGTSIVNNTIHNGTSNATDNGTVAINETVGASNGSTNSANTTNDTSTQTFNNTLRLLPSETLTSFKFCAYNISIDKFIDFNYLVPNDDNRTFNQSNGNGWETVQV